MCLFIFCLSVGLTIAEHIDNIRQLYKVCERWVSPFPWSEDFYLPVEQIFARLTMFKREKNAKGTVIHEVNEMDEIFKPYEEKSTEAKRVLIEGNPGTGKTMYCSKIAYDWATRDSTSGDWFSKFQVVLLLKCRHIVGREFDLWQAIDDQLLPREIQKEEREELFKFVRDNQSKVLLVLDGFDELPQSQLPTFFEIIQGRILPGCNLLVTARHEGGIPIRKYFDFLLEIQEFTPQNSQEFVHEFFKGKDDLAEKLLLKVKEDKNLQEIMFNPLNSALLCLICEEFEGNLPKNITRLYLEIVHCILKIFNKKNGLPVNEDLLAVYKDQLKQLGSVALNGLLRCEKYFDEGRLGNYLEVLGFGFLSAHPGGSKLRPCLYYSFLHTIFQQLFAAFFLSCHVVEEKISVEKIANNEIYLDKLKQVLLFTCGILAIQEKEKAVTLIKFLMEKGKKGDAVAGFVVMECFEECRKENGDSDEELAVMELNFKGQVTGLGKTREYFYILPSFRLRVSRRLPRRLEQNGSAHN